jgi:hypothetical protein
MKAWEFHEAVRKAYAQTASGDFTVMLRDKENGQVFEPTGDVKLSKSNRTLIVEVEISE